jgi:ribosomal-protein-alanine N-acetyltransferase
MTNSPHLRTDRTLLRLAQPSDAAQLLEFFRAAGKRLEPPLPDALLTLEHWRTHSELLLKEQADGASAKLFVFTPDESEILGTVGLIRITRGIRFDCSLSYALRPSHEGQGLMSEAVRAAIRHAFDDLGLHRVEAVHTLDNQRSQRLLERLGFERVGIIRGFLRSAGGWRDTLLHSLTNPDWLPP